MAAEQLKKDDRIEFRDLLDQYFDLSGLKSLSFDLGIHYGNIAGETQRNKFEFLIAKLGQENRLQELLDLAAAERPDLNWPQINWDSYDWFQPFPATTPTSLYQSKPKESFEPELVFVPAGPFVMGSDSGEAHTSPPHEVNLPAFWISRRPITNQAFATYIWKAKLAATPAMRWAGNSPAAGQEQNSVTGVTWYEALAYCRWLTEVTGRAYNLPSEAQWEKGACGLIGTESAAGFMEGVGDMREWTSTLWGHSTNEPDPLYQYPWSDDLRNDIDQPSTILRVFRGGAKKDQQECRTRAGFDPTKPGPRRSRHGLRVVCHP